MEMKPINQLDDNGAKIQFSPITVVDAVKLSEDSDVTLREELDNLKVPKENTSKGSGYGIVMEWEDGNPLDEDRTGKFVTISSTSAGKIKVATINDYIYGVVVDSLAYREGCEDISNEPSKDMVCIAGVATVLCRTGYTERDFTDGKKIVVSEAGNATISEDNYGYPVMKLVDDTHIDILYIPNQDYIQRAIMDLRDLYSRINPKVLLDVDEDDNIVISSK